ncbi:sensor histidine kinase [Martelella soudanensis]|uniref:sensor histidine kinase n=1 Tax=unclassified Martelella TaxID=2629616 RepID=UPI0015DE8318|nr:MULTISPECIES: HAMP domain-containing sensor histidine kinase [unclassified Martelella]
MPRFLAGLSGRILTLTVAVIMFAEVVFFVPALSTMRLRWLDDRLNTAAAAVTVIDGLQPLSLPRALQDETLMATGTKAIVLRKDGMSQLLAVADMPPEISRSYDLTDVGPVEAVVDAFDELLFGGGRAIRILGHIGDSDAIIELVISDDELRHALLIYARNIFALSILLSSVTAMLIFFRLNSMLVRPLRRQIANMQAFSEHPDLPESVFRASDERDELGIAGRHLATMQSELQKTLRQQKRLAELGLAVSKINHDMRNILAAAQLMSDRIAGTDDPVVKRIAPKLLRAIDRAAAYSRTVLSYGQVSEAEPKRRLVDFRMLVNDVHDYLELSADPSIEWINRVPEGLNIDADPEQLFRVIFNLCRNSVEALGQQARAKAETVNCLTVSAQRHGSVVSLTIDDTGPGMPQKARENLFAAFRGSARSGGTGLGLAIARELVLAHGGTIGLVEKAGQGTLFRIEIPDRPVMLESWREESGAGG